MLNLYKGVFLMTYYSLSPSDHSRFASVQARMARLKSTFHGSFTTPDKVEEALRVLSEVEDLCTELRVQLDREGG